VGRVCWCGVRVMGIVDGEEEGGERERRGVGGKSGKGER